jgi:Pyrimidine dimer DNA glycosylase
MMNIFVLDNDPELCAHYHCDKHVVKMILETAQLLSTAHRVVDEGCLFPELDKNLYKKTHQNHPSAIWVRENYSNYSWVAYLFECLLEEYTYRYGKVHASEKLTDYVAWPPLNIKTSSKMTPFKLAMPDVYKTDDPVQSYRNYYIGEKKSLFAWKNRDIPYWIPKDLNDDTPITS